MHKNNDHSKFRKRLLNSIVVIGLIASPLAAVNLRADEKRMQYHVAAQSISTAIIQFANQSKLRIAASGIDISNYQTQGVTGRLTQREALASLLEGTDLDYEYTGDNTVVIKRKENANVDSATGSAKQKTHSLQERFNIEEVVITATRRETSLQDTGLSISVLTGSQLEKRGVTSVGEIISTIPGVDMPSGAPGNTSIVVRGISTSVFGEGPNSTTDNQTTSSYLDELPLSLGIADIRMVDLERVEVLKGPQGTLYGQSAMGGVVRYITNKPDTDALSGKIGGRVSQVKSGGVSHDLQGYVNVPISDTLAARAAVYRYDNAGFIDAIGSDIEDDANTEKTMGGRFRLRWQMGDRLTLDTTYLWQEIDLGAEQMATTTFTPVPYTFPPVEPADLAPINLADPKMQHVNPSVYQDNVLSLKLEAEFDTFNLMAIGAKKQASFYFLEDVCLYVDISGQTESGGGIRCPHTNDRNRDIETLELRMVSKEPVMSFLDWIVGVWYENKDDLDRVDSMTTFERVGDNINLFNALIFTEGDTLENWDRTFDSNELAFYGELGLNFTDHLKLTLGYRRSNVETNRETINADGLFDILIGRDSALNIDPRTEENVNTYKFNLEYQATDDILLYALASSGYRAGGFNVGAFPFVPPSTYSSDTLWNYELGAKTGWLDGQFIFNLSAYQINWNDIQLSIINPPVFVATRVNAGKARIRGVEVESNYYFNDNLNAGLSFSWKEGVLREDYESGGSVVATSGSRLPASSKLTYTVYADWRTTVTADMSFSIYAAHRYVGERQGDLGTTDRFDAYSITDVKAGLICENGFEVSVFADNLFNNIVATNLERAGLYHRRSAINRPRTIGLRVGYSF